MSATQASSLALGVFGLLGADETIWGLDEDCYSAFRALSAVMGYLTSADPADSVTGLWGMNDADGPWIGRAPQGRRAQFQVTPTRQHDLGIPLEPFTWAALATVERFGAFDLHGLEYYIPLHLAAASRASVRAGKAWYGALAPRVERTRIRITIDSGAAPTVSERSEAIAAVLNRVSPAEEQIEVTLDAGGEPVDFADPVPWRWWLGEGEPHTTTLHATATGWDALAVGHVAAQVSEACRIAGVTDAIGMRIVKADP